jgi:uncharacterized SAM-binding protein YcdF (DUF218 family)
LGAWRQKIQEDQATTTFENALYTSRIIKAHRYQSVILVTSDYHMPRSLALLQLFLAGERRAWGVAMEGEKWATKCNDYVSASCCNLTN